MKIAFEVAKMLGSLIGTFLDFMAAEGKTISIIFSATTVLMILYFVVAPTAVAQALTALTYIMGVGAYCAILFKRWVDADTASV